MPEITYLKATMSTVSTRGEFRISFNGTVPDFDVSLLNADNTIAYIEIDEGRKLESDFDVSKLNFTWKVSKAPNDRSILIKIDWNSPLSISPKV